MSFIIWNNFLLVDITVFWIFIRRVVFLSAYTYRSNPSEFSRNSLCRTEDLFSIAIIDISKPIDTKVMQYIWISGFGYDKK